MTFQTSSSSGGTEAVSEDQEHSGSEEAGDAIIQMDSYMPPSTKTPNVDAVKSVHAIDEIKTTITMPLQDYPPGYPRQAAFQSITPSFSIYRAFNYLHSRVILELQDELRSLEDDLIELDQMDFENGDGLRLQSRAHDLRQASREKTESERANLIAVIRDKLVLYDEILIKARDIQAFQHPSGRYYRSFRTWFWNEKPLSYEREEEFIKRRDDLITLRSGREYTVFDGMVVDTLQKIIPKTSALHRLLTTQELRTKIDKQPHVYFYSPRAIRTLVGMIITIIIFILLVLPIVAMYRLTSIGNRNPTFDAVGILVVFTLLFSVSMSLLTQAKRHELFASSAAYCAVLVVFISNFNGSSMAEKST